MEEKNTNQTQNTSGQEQMKLDDARRVKSMSPTQMVMKRFMRNKLAITGAVIIVAMFLFSFVGPFFIPYTESQVFRGTEYMVKDYAGAVENKDLNYLTDASVPSDANAVIAFKRALAEGTESFQSSGVNYTFQKLDENSYEIFAADTIATVMAKGKMFLYSAADGFEITDDFKKAFEAAQGDGETSFTYEDQEYVIGKQDRSISIGVAKPAALATTWLFDAYDTEDSLAAEYALKEACIRALAEEESSIKLDGQKYELKEIESGYLVVDSTDTERVLVSKMKINAKASDIKLAGEFRLTLCDAVREGKSSFVMVEDGQEVEYTLKLSNGTYLVKANMPTEVRRAYERPSIEHPLGIDGNGMDVLTRLMYGGRISLLVGFVVVFIELALGVIIGGISGYFGGAIDTFLMRFVDLFNSIPFWPMVLIFGSVMDNLEVNPTVRMFILMAILGILGWTGIARVVRGQILSLREQDFMIATEATGIRTSRRIFRHLVPNVMPLLIVQATMSLGGIILTEATMSFLGLGVKYPMASWGSIINAANDIRVMTNYWFIWLPAGVLIMLTVLGFNFVGDGLRDAFDPRMKR